MRMTTGRARIGEHQSPRPPAPQRPPGLGFRHVRVEWTGGAWTGRLGVRTPRQQRSQLWWGGPLETRFVSLYPCLRAGQCNGTGEGPLRIGRLPTTNRRDRCLSALPPAVRLSCVQAIHQSIAPTAPRATSKRGPHSVVRKDSQARFTQPCPGEARQTRIRRRGLHPSAPNQ